MEKLVNHLVVDIESTGLSTLWDEPVQIAIGKVDTQGEIHTEVFWSRTEREINPKAQEVHGITPEVLKQKGMPPELAAQRYVDTVRQYDPCIIIGYNFINFDQPMLQSWLFRNIKGYFKFPPCVAIFDAMFLARDYFKQKKWPKLIDAARRLGIPFRPEELHDAKEDVRLTWEVYKKLEGL